MSGGWGDNKYTLFAQCQVQSSHILRWCSGKGKAYDSFYMPVAVCKRLYLIIENLGANGYVHWQWVLMSWCKLESGSRWLFGDRQRSSKEDNPWGTKKRGQYGAMSFLVNFEEYDKRIEVRTAEMLGDRWLASAIADQTSKWWEKQNNRRAPSAGEKSKGGIWRPNSASKWQVPADSQIGRVCGCWGQLHDYTRLVR